MKTCIGGDGSDTTSAVWAWLAANNNLPIANLYLIGEPGHPASIWLTDYESPLLWSAVPKKFLPAVIRKGAITNKIGLDIQQLTVTWSPRQTSYLDVISQASPYKLARHGYYDNWPVRIWDCYMPVPGDANTFGCSEAFGGHVAKIRTNMGRIEFTINSFLDVVDQRVPTNVVELLNTAAAYSGAMPPKGFTQIPQFTVLAGSTTNVIYAQQTFPGAGDILDSNIVQHGFLVFNTINPDEAADPPVLGSTLGGVWAAIQQNTSAPAPSGGGDANQFILYGSLPWPPTPGRDTCYVSGPAPINRDDGEYYGFPFVPAPELAL